MYFGFALDFSDKDLWDIDFLDKDLDLLDTDISSKHFVCLQDVFNMSSRRNQHNNFSSSKTSCEMSSRHFRRRKIVTLKTCWRRLRDVLKTNNCLMGNYFYDISLFVGVIPEPVYLKSIFNFFTHNIKSCIYKKIFHLFCVDRKIFFLFKYSAYNSTELSTDLNILKELNGPNISLKILDSCVFENPILSDEPFAKALRILETCVLVNINLCGKLVLSLESPTTLDERFKVTSVPFFVPDFNLWSCKLDNFTSKCYI